MSTVSNPATGLSTAIPIPTGLPASAPPIVSQESVLRQIPSAQPYRFTVEQLERMIKAGVLGKYDRCELIRGEFIQKMTIGDRHVAAVNRLIRYFKRVKDDEALMNAPNAIKLLDSRPEPDFALLIPREDCYESRTARPADVLLLVEVSDSSLDCLEVHRQPQGLDHAQRFVVRRGDSVSPLALPTLSLTAEMVLGEVPPAERGCQAGGGRLVSIRSCLPVFLPAWAHYDRTIPATGGCRDLSATGRSPRSSAAEAAERYRRR